MSFLLRTRVGSYTLADAYTLQEIADAPESCKAEPLTAVAELPKLVLTGRQAARITNGVRTTIAGTSEGRYVLLGPEGEFLGLGSCNESMIKADKILEHFKMPEEE